MNADAEQTNRELLGAIVGAEWLMAKRVRASRLPEAVQGYLLRIIGGARSTTNAAQLFDEIHPTTLATRCERAGVPTPRAVLDATRRVYLAAAFATPADAEAMARVFGYANGHSLRRFVSTYAGSWREERGRIEAAMKERPKTWLDREAQTWWRCEVQAHLPGWQTFTPSTPGASRTEAL